MNRVQNHLPGGVGAAAPASERDPAVEADELALSKIRNMCAVAMISAEDLAQEGLTQEGLTQEGLAQPVRTDMSKLQRLRFGSAKRMSLELAKTVSAASCRDAALQHIIELCMSADDLEASRILVQGIQSAPIREELLLRYPALLP